MALDEFRVVFQVKQRRASHRCSGSAGARFGREWEAAIVAVEGSGGQWIVRNLASRKSALPRGILVATGKHDIPLRDLLAQVRACRHCEDSLPLGPNPVLRASATARLLIIGQAPGTRVHASGIPWNDPSGDRLRQWLQLDSEQFYDEARVAIVPMGFCYPGRGKSGDLPPPPACAPLWHGPLQQQMPNLQLVLLVGSYAQQYYQAHTSAAAVPGETLTMRVQRWREFGPRYFPLPHPSPRNNLWLRPVAAGCVAGWFWQEGGR
ncbi:MAG: uracil-DNA glycosylase family protein [Pseudomonadales bacterium]|nr:uracil-DNA glycosylase family protein [Pseudomonadales bacterium]